MKNLAFVVLILVLGIQSINAQNKIILLNGKTIEAAKLNYDFPKNMVYYQTENSTKTRVIDGSDVFSLLDSKNVETIVYTPIENQEFSVNEMRSVVSGGATAINDYKPIWPLLVGFGVGFGSMVLPVDPILSLPIPILFNVGIAFIRPSGGNIMKNYPDLYTDDLFVYGFKQTGRNKILKRSVLGTVAGMAVGIASSFVFSKLAE